MSAKEKGLGRGLKSLLPAAEENSSLSNVDISRIVPNKTQPRKAFRRETLEELAESIKNQGIIQPLIVRPLPGSPGTYEIIAGERRWRAAQLAGIQKLPVIITNYHDKEAMTVALTENLQREDLNAMEEAEALHALRSALGCSQEDLAGKLGKSRPAVANALRLLLLPEAIQDSVRQEKISAGHARSLLRLEDQELQMRLHDAIAQKHLSVRETEAAAEYCREHGDLPASLKLAGHTPPQRKKTPQDIKNLQKSLRSLCGKKITIKGSKSSGHILIPYDSEEELTNLAEMISSKKTEK